MFNDFRERRRLRRRISEVNRALDVTPWAWPHLDEVIRLRERLDPLEAEFDLLETRRLRRQTDRLCIEIPKDREGWWHEISFVPIHGCLKLDANALTSQGQRGTRKLIREERFRQAKKWAELLIPVLSLVIAILALTLR